MITERFVLLGVARARSLWFRAVAQWATSASIPADFVKCLSPEEVAAHLGSGRTFSAALLDGGLPAVDRDLIAAAREAGCAVVVVDDGRGRRNWQSLGAAAVLPADFDRDQLLEVLAAHAVMIGGDEATRVALAADEPVATRLARVVAVCGPGGTGASTAAMALAQHLATDDRGDTPIVLADLALRAEQSMLHDVRDIVPGVQELVEAHRGRRPDAREVNALTFAVEGRGYHLLLGLRRARYWSTVRPRAFEAAFDSLRTTFGTVVCDIEADFEGEDEGGSVDVEERNLMARTAALRADAVVVVGAIGTKGLHSLVRVVGDAIEAGVAADRIVPVVNHAPRNPKTRAEVTAAFSSLLGRRGPTPGALASPVFLPHRRVETAIRDGSRLPPPLGPLLAGAVRSVWDGRESRTGTVIAQPQPVTPGSLGSWTPEGQL